MAATYQIAGMDQLKARMKALRKTTGQPAAKAWAVECRDILERMTGAMPMPYSGTGGGRYGSKSNPGYVLRRSFKVKAGRSGKALAQYTVVGSFHTYFVDAGVKPHSLATRAGAPKGRTVFARAARSLYKSQGRKHPGYPARPFRVAAAREAQRRVPVLDTVVQTWNEAA